jgi:deoxyadenosine/deoxycytidine kinase
MDATFTINTLENVYDIISIQGSIGAGKSYLIEAVKEVVNEMGLSAEDDELLQTNDARDLFLVIDEPLESWTTAIYNTGRKTAVGEDIDILTHFYADKEKNAFLFQVKAFTSRLQAFIEKMRNLRETNARVHIISERSLRSDRLFFKNLYDNGYVSHMEYDVYCEFYDTICEDVNNCETTMIYVKTPAKTCNNRIISRARTGEVCDISYLETIETAHTEMLDEFLTRGKVIEIDFADDIDNDGVKVVAERLIARLLGGYAKIDKQLQKKQNKHNHNDILAVFLAFAFYAIYLMIKHI